jgi:hypothetical protein
MNARLWLLGCLVAASCGCTHIQLRNNVVNQSWTVSDFHRQQVLNNLALFAFDNNALPYFSFPNQSSAFVTDQGFVGLTPSWSRFTNGLFLFNALGLSLTAQRSAQEGFTVTPVNDPRKLELMRCAYQKAISNCGCAKMAERCPDCKTRFKTFYTGDPDGDIAATTGGITTTECMQDFCWLQIGCKKCVPKHCPCNYVGHYCGVYVWVMPEGRDELTKLTLTILDFALRDPPQRLTKSVVYYIDELGLPADKDGAVGQVSANIAINERNESLLSMGRDDEVRILEILENSLNAAQAKLADPNLQATERTTVTRQRDSLQRRIDYLNEQLRLGGLKEEFYPSGAGPIAPFSVIPQLQQQIQTLTAPRTLP